MNLNEIQSLWNSPSNQVPDTEHERLARQFVRQMIRRRRFESIWLIITFAWLTVISVLAFRNLAGGKLSPSIEWAVFPLLLVPWAFAIHFLRRYLKPPVSASRGESPVAESFRAALFSTHAEQSQLKWVAALWLILVPVLIVAARQLESAGKVSPRELECMMVFFGGAFLVSGLGIAIRYFGWLSPRRRRLVGLLDELETAEPRP